MSKKNILKIVLLWVFAGAVAGAGYFFSLSGSNESKVEYSSKEYGFKISLPESWAGYSVTIDKWTGNAIGDQLGDVAFADGPVVSIHHPKWKGGTTYQDIPIMVFSISQWEDLRLGKFHIGAGPVGPSELTRNSRYVFALPARYNYSFPEGYEEVGLILQSKSVTAF